MIEVIISKRGCTCGEVKALELFDRNEAAKDGRRESCKACRSARSKRQYAERKAAGIVRSRAPAKREPLWPLPTHTLTEGLDCVRLRNWRGPVSREPLRFSL